MGDPLCEWATLNIGFLKSLLEARTVESEYHIAFRKEISSIARSQLASSADAVIILLGGAERIDVALEIGMLVERRFAAREKVHLLMSPFHKIPAYLEHYSGRNQLTVHSLEDIKATVAVLIQNAKLT